jgi:flavin-dependent dehydrogenase
VTSDVVVLGGGPAGLAAAIASASAGITTCLIERRTFPIDKPCGEGLLPNGVALAIGLGIRRENLERVGRPIAGIRYLSPSGATAEGLFAGPAGLGLRRVDLSRVLLARARECAGLQVLSGCAAALSPRPEGGYEVRAAGASLRPRLVVIADGLGSRLARSIGIPTIVCGPRRWGARQHFGGTPWSDRVEVHFADGCEAYVTPLAEGLNVAVLWDAERRRWPAGESVIDRALDLFPSLRERLAGLAPLDRASAAGPFHQRPASRAADGVVLVGDAAGYIDALTGEGVGLALLHAALFGAFAGRVLGRGGGGVVPRVEIDAFVRQVDAATRPNRQLTRTLLRLSRHPSLVERVIRLLAASPALFEHALAANMGEREAWRIPVASLWQPLAPLGRSGARRS